MQLVALESAPKDERSAFAAYSRLPNIATDDWLQFQKDINNTGRVYPQGSTAAPAAAATPAADGAVHATVHAVHSHLLPRPAV